MSELKNPFTLKALSSWVLRENMCRYNVIPPLIANCFKEEKLFLSSLSGQYSLVEGKHGGILENNFREFTFTSKSENSLFCNSLGNFIHHFSEDNGSVFTTGPPNRFISRVFQGSINEDISFNKELVYTQKKTLNVLTFDNCYEGSIDNLFIGSTHDTIFRLSETNTNVYTLYFERNYTWFKCDTLTEVDSIAEFGKYIKK